MTKRTGGARRKTRSKFRKNIKEKGKVSIQRYLQTFKKGEKVLLQADPSIHKGIYFRRFHSKTGIIQAKRGSCYEVELKEGKKQKIAIIHPIHLRKR